MERKEEVAISSVEKELIKHPELAEAIEAMMRVKRIENTKASALLENVPIYYHFKKANLHK